MSSDVRCVFLLQFSRLYRIVAIAELRVYTIMVEFAFQTLYVPNLGQIPRRTCDLTYIWPAIDGSVR